VEFAAGVLGLPKVGAVKAVYSRSFEGKIKAVTVSKTPTGKYFASVRVEEESQPSIQPDVDDPLRDRGVFSPSGARGGVGMSRTCEAGKPCGDAGIPCASRHAMAGRGRMSSGLLGGGSAWVLPMQSNAFTHARTVSSYTLNSRRSRRSLEYASLVVYSV